MSNQLPQRQQPIASYRIRYSQGNIAVIDYADDRAEAVAYAAKVGGKVECYVYGMGWERIGKVAAR